MLMLMIHVGDDLFAIESNCIVKVVPLAELKKIDHVPIYVLGFLNYGGLPIPIIDLCYLMKDKPCQKCMHTRILLFKFIEPDGQVFHIGFMAEKVTQTLNRERSEFIDSKVRIHEATYLDGILTDQERTIQFIDARELFHLVKGILFEQMKAFV